MKLQYLCAFTFFCFCFFPNCSDDDGGGSPAERLTGGTWTLAESRSDFDGDGVFTDDAQDCDLDNTATFNPNGSLLLDDGAVKCDPNGQQTLEGTWSLTASGSTLSLMAANSFVWQVLELSDSRLELRGLTNTALERLYIR